MLALCSSRKPTNYAQSNAHIIAASLVSVNIFCQLWCARYQEGKFNLLAKAAKIIF